MRATSGVAFTALLACGAIAPVAAFTGAGSFASVASRQHASVRSRRPGASPVMAIDPATVHSVGEYVNAVGTAGLDQAWLSSVMHGEGRGGRLLRVSCVGRNGIFVRSRPWDSNHAQI